MNQSWEDERDPLAALRRGDPGPFEAFVRTELGTLLGFFLRLGARRAEAEDLTQDLLVKLYEHSADYEPRGRFAPYAFRVARNLWLDRGRRRLVRGVPAGSAGGEDQDLLARIEDEGAEPPSAALARREEAARLREALARLGEGHRLVFELGVLQGLAYQDVAEALEIPVGTVKSRMFHAVRRLREALGAEWAGDAAEREPAGRPERSAS